MTEKEYPIFAFEERRRFGVDMSESKNELSILESFLDEQKLERKPKSSVFNVFVENLNQQYRRNTSSSYQIIRYENYILSEFLIEYYDFEVEAEATKILNCNKIFEKKGDEGLKDMFKSIIRTTGKDGLELDAKYGLDTIYLLRTTKNPIQVEKTTQEQTLKLTYKIDL
jgi:hypothetical protein